MDQLLKPVAQLSLSEMTSELSLLARDPAFLSLALDFLSLPLQIPSQVVQLIEKLARTCARQAEGSFGIQAQLLRICHASSRSIRPEARAPSSHSDDAAPGIYAC
jgi:hypothetical protein